MLKHIRGKTILKAIIFLFITILGEGLILNTFSPYIEVMLTVDSPIPVSVYYFNGSADGYYFDEDHVVHNISTVEGKNKIKIFLSEEEMKFIRLDFNSSDGRVKVNQIKFALAPFLQIRYSGAEINQTFTMQNNISKHSMTSDGTVEYALSGNDPFISSSTDLLTGKNREFMIEYLLVVILPIVVVLLFLSVYYLLRQDIRNLCLAWPKKTNNQRKAILIISIFILILAVPILTIRWTSGDYSASEKRNLAAFPQIISQSEEGINANLYNESVQWLEDHIGLRSQMVELTSSIKYYLLRQSPSESVEIGKDDWLFYTPDNNLKIADGSYPNFGESNLEQIASRQVEIQQSLAEQGIEYFLVLPPSKVSIYPEYIASGDYAIRETPVDILADYLESNTDIKVIRLKEDLIAAKEEGELYFKNDTHWNDRGAYVAYRAIIETINEFGIDCGNPVEVNFDVGEHYGDLINMIGNIYFSHAISCPVSIIQNQSAEKLMSGEERDALTSFMQTNYPNIQSYLYRNPDASECNVLIFGDSMFGSWNMTELLAENFSELSYIWRPTVEQDIVDFVKPDVVFLEITERSLNNL